MISISLAHAATQVPANQVTVITSGFSKNLNSTDTSVQKALNTLDQTTTGGGGTPSGSTGQYQWNNGGNFAGGNMLYTNGTNIGINNTSPGQTLDVTGTVRATLFSGSAASLTNFPTLNQNTTGTASNVTGTVAIANGGTGQTTAQAAINSLAGATTSTYYLRGTGTNVTMAAIQAGDVPTLNQNTTGTASNVTGTVAIANGGTGQTAQQAALDALSGAQTSTYYLRSNGTHVSLSAIQAGDVPTLNQNTTGNAATVTTNANLTGPITSVGNATSIASQTGTGTKFVVQASPELTGNVGINSLTPGQALDVTGTVRMTGLQLGTSATNGYVLTTNASGVGTWQNAVGAVSSVSNSDGSLTITPTTGAVVASLNPAHANAWTAQQTVVGANVGVGSTNPSQALDVSGTVRATAMTITGLSTQRPLYVDSNNKVATGLFSGSTTTMATTSGTLSNGHIATFDLSGNVVDGGAPTAGGTVTSVGLSSPNNTLIIGSTPVTTSGTLTGDINWPNLNAIAKINMGGINWTDAPNLTYGVNWQSVNLITNSASTMGTLAGVLQLFNSTGTNYVNWTTIGGLATNYALKYPTAAPTAGQMAVVMDSLGDINWENLSQLNWATVTGYTTGNCLGATTAGGINWTTCGSGSSSQWTTVTPGINYSGGNVGIGSATPGTTLDVAGTIRGTSFTLNGSNITSWPSGSGTVASGTTNYEAVYTGSTTVGSGIITDNGTNIGIGTALPITQLEMRGSGSSFYGPQVTNTNSSGYAQFALYNSAGNGMLFFASGSGYAIPNTNGIFSSTGTSESFGKTNGTINVTIDPSGNVGIGSANPNSILNIPALKSTTGTRFLCIGTTGIVTSATTCTGT